MEEQKGRGQDFQGIEREYCGEDILIALLDGDFGFNELVKRFERTAEKVKERKRTYSRGTVYKYLRDLVEENKVQYSDNKLEYGQLKRPYTLTPEGKKEAENLLPLNIVRSWSNEQLNEFVINYRLMVILDIIQYFGKRAYKEGVIDKATYGRLMALERRQDGQETAKAIDNDLRVNGFSHDEIIRLWLMDKGVYIRVILQKLDNAYFRERFPFKNELSGLTDKQKNELKEQIRISIMLNQKIKQVNKIFNDLSLPESILGDSIDNTDENLLDS